ncbi:hypothetical protein L596_030812 [Steinernema carpocapsae]|uniref:molybdopterin adenylyltransferase n=1 Tax=Steinernema carpocapsae TaxID=34508 RepID=A0A4U5LNU2_STECR|nr:hypothetical protein L596_030812 [Steinernema carpocapsae]
MTEHFRHSPYPMVPMDKALAIISEETGSDIIVSTEMVDIYDFRGLLGRTLAEDVVAATDKPSFRTSVMDGYAVRAEDGDAPRKVVAVTTAGGTNESYVLQKGECCRVSTGSQIVVGADAVVMREDTGPVEDEQDQGDAEILVLIKVAPKVGQFIRQIGVDFSKGTVLIPKGTVLKFQHAGILAESCYQQVQVYKSLSVEICSTGNEICHDVYDRTTKSERIVVPPFGQIYDTNYPNIVTQLLKSGCKPSQPVALRDNPEEIREKLSELINKDGGSPVIITTGGVSMGEKDHLKDVLKSLGCNVHFGRVNMKPGKPATFSTITNKHGKKKFIFSLPGNPVSVFVCMELFVLPFLKKLSGQNVINYTKIPVEADQTIQLDERLEYRRAVFVVEGNRLIARTTHPNQTSSAVISTRDCNLLMELPSKTAEKLTIQQGELVNALVIGPI